MTSLTVREKEHWKERISRKIELAIEELYAQEHPAFREEVHQEAKTLAEQSLGIHELRNEAERLKKEIRSLEERRSELFRRMYGIVENRPTEAAGWSSHEPHAIELAVRDRIKVHRQSILAKSDTGRQVLELEREKEELLDTVWLATSSSQVKELWQKVADILQQQPTKLQQEAIAIPTVTTE